MTSVNSTSTNYYIPEASSKGSLDRDGNTIDTGKYTIEITRDNVLITDKETGKTVRAWGDPHLHTGDGDYAQFHDENLTIELDDGTKITMKPTELGDGKEWIDSVGISRGNDGFIVNNVHEGEIGFSKRTAFGVDRAFEDGTVLGMRDDVDDLFFRATGEDLVGGSMSNETLLDGIFGQASLQFDKIMFPEGATYFQKLAVIEQFLADQRDDTIDKLAGELNASDENRDDGAIKKLEAALQEINGLLENVARFRSSGIASMMQTANTIAGNL